MWFSGNIDEKLLWNIAFSEKFSFCVSNPEFVEYKEGDLLCERRHSTNRSKIKNVASDAKQRRRSYPVASENANRHSVKINEVDDCALEHLKNFTNAPKIDRYGSRKPIRRRNSTVESESDKQHSGKMSQSLNTQTTLIQKINSSDLQKLQMTIYKRDGTFGFTVAAFIGGIFVKSLTRKRIVSKGIIRPGDRILKLNGRHISSFSHSQVITYLRNLPESVNLKICRSCTVWEFCSKHSQPQVQMFNAVLEKPPNGVLNFSIRDSVEGSDIQKYLVSSTAEVEEVFPNSVAHCVGIKTGDSILEVNGESLLGKKAEDVVDILQKINGVLKLVFCRHEVKNTNYEKEVFST